MYNHKSDNKNNVIEVATSQSEKRQGRRPNPRPRESAGLELLVGMVENRGVDLPEAGDAG